MLGVTVAATGVSAQDRSQIRANEQGFQQMETRLATLNAKGVPLTDYHLAKAQAWLDFSKEEYFDNDRSGIVETTFAEAVKLIEQLESGITASLEMTTPLLEGPTRLETDSWEKTESFKRSKLDCAAHLIARLEVQLVHVEHEIHELGQIHAAPYRQAVQRMVEELKTIECSPHAKQKSEVPKESPSPGP